jgi:adenylate kinase family enzyme
MRRMFVIGGSGCGKTTFAESMKILGYKHIEASGSLKKDYPKRNDESNLEYTERITEIAKPLVLEGWFLNSIKNKINEKDNFILTGIRNPIDFVALFCPKRDAVIFLPGETKTPFEEKGINAINEILNFYKTLGDVCIIEVVKASNGEA